MIHYIKGTYVESGRDFIIVECCGIGYKVYAAPSTMGRIGSPGSETKLYTYFHVREDIMALYGFLTKEELDMFELLISVSGVGPKAGLSVLSMLTPARIGLAIIGGDAKTLTKVPGIGSKTAQRIVLELKDKIDKDGILEPDMDAVEVKDDAAREAVNALMTLGYSAVEASSAIRKIDIEGKDMEKIIKEALKNLMK